LNLLNAGAGGRSSSAPQRRPPVPQFVSGGSGGSGKGGTYNWLWF
jgi:hypothetical protein